MEANSSDQPADKISPSGTRISGIASKIVNSVNRSFSLGVFRPRPAGQSLVELAILFPILLMLLSGIVEFGFLLNQYLNLLDGAREAARFASDGDPTIRDANRNCSQANGTITRDFYNQAACLAIQVALPIQLDPSRDDVIVSAFGVADGTVKSRYPTVPNDPPGGTETPGEWHMFGVGGSCVSTDSDCNPSQFSNSRVNSYLSGTAPNTGIVLVEIYYDYNQILSLPWITAFVPDPISIHTFAIMPLVAAEPEPTPGP